MYNTTQLHNNEICICVYLIQISSAQKMLSATLSQLVTAQDKRNSLEILIVLIIDYNFYRIPKHYQ